MRKTIQVALLMCLMLLVSALMFTACNISNSILPTITTSNNGEQTTPSNDQHPTSNGGEQILPDVGVPITKSADAIHSGQLILVNSENQYTFPADVSLLSIYDNMVKKLDESAIYRPVSHSFQLEAEALHALNEMMYHYYELDNGATFAISSAYRTFEDQASMNSSILPGYSDHHTGYCIAIQYSDRSALENDHWIYQNCYQYGFVVRYPEGKESITGVSNYMHCLRYVGVEHATFMYQNGLCLEEYVEFLKNNYTSWTNRLPIVSADGRTYEVYYVAASDQEFTTINVPSHYLYDISGDNNSGFIVTVRKY